MKYISEMMYVFSLVFIVCFCFVVQETLQDIAVEYHLVSDRSITLAVEESLFVFHRSGFDDILVTTGLGHQGSRTSSPSCIKNAHLLPEGPEWKALCWVGDSGIPNS